MNSERGGEYSSTNFLDFLNREGIKTENGTAYCPTANSVSEQFFRTLLGRMRTRLLQSGLASTLRGKLAVYCGLQMTCKSNESLDMRIPMTEFENLMTGHLHPFDFSWLRPSGCLAFVHQQQRPSKPAPNSKAMVFLGLERGARAARRWDMGTCWVLVLGDVQYCEDVFPAKALHKPLLLSDTPQSVSLIVPSYLNTPPPAPGSDMAMTPFPPLPPPHHLDSLQTLPDKPPPLPAPGSQTPSSPAASPNYVPASSADSPDLRRSDRPRAPVVHYGFSATNINSADHNHPS